MDFRIGDHKTSKIKTVELKLEKYPNGDVFVMSGGWHLVGFRTDGTLRRSVSIGDDLGFRLNKLGQIKPTRDEDLPERVRYVIVASEPAEGETELILKMDGYGEVDVMSEGC